MGMGMEAAGGVTGDFDVEEGRQLRERPKVTWKTAVAYIFG